METARFLASNIEIFQHGQVRKDAAILGREPDTKPGDFEGL